MAGPVGRLLARSVVRVAVLVAVLGVVFAAVDLLPGNAARGVLDRGATAAQVSEAEHRLGLDRPLPERFLDWLTSLVGGDLGTSAHGVSVADLLAARLPVTLATSGTALVLTVVLSLVIGAWWIRRPGTRAARAWDVTSTGLVALPEFVVGTGLVLVFALLLDVLPAVTIAGADGTPATTDMYVLPVLALVIPQVAWNTRVVRSALLDAASLPHVRAAELAGVEGPALVARHVVPVAAPTIAMSFATTVGVMVSGTVAVEALFNHPGVGSLVAEAVRSRDVPVLAAVLAVTGVLLMALLALVDVIRLATSTRGAA